MQITDIINRLLALAVEEKRAARREWAKAQSDPQRSDPDRHIRNAERITVAIEMLSPLTRK